MDRAHWTSPSFRGRSPHPRQSNPRFRGDGNYGTPTRHFTPHWQQRSPSPYRYQQGHGGSFTPHYHPHPYATSTPIHGSSGGRRPFFRGGGGGGRFNKRPAFGSPSFGKGASSDDIESWISPEMWADPWRHLGTASVSNIGCTTGTFNEPQDATKFAESDFNITPSASESRTNDNQSEGSITKFADSDFNVTDSKITDIDEFREPAQKTQDSCTSAEVLSAPTMKSNDSKRIDDEEFEKYATDRVVLDTDKQLLS